MRQFGRLAEEEILDDEELQTLQRRMDLLQIWIGLSDVIPDDPERLEPTSERRVPTCREFSSPSPSATGDRSRPDVRRQGGISERLIPGKEGR